MFESSFLEMLVVGIVALLVIGPERLPTIAAKVGHWIGKGRRLIASTRADLERELRTEQLHTMLNKQEDEIRELRSLMQQQNSEVRSAIENTVPHSDTAPPSQNTTKYGS